MQRFDRATVTGAILSAGAAMLLLAGCGGAGGQPGEPLSGSAVASARLTYELVSTGEGEDDELDMTVPDEVALGHEDLYFSEASVRESAALTNFILGLQAATRAYFAELIEHCEESAASVELVCPDWLDETYMTCEEWETQERETERLTCLGNNTDIPVDIAAGSAAMDEVIAFLEGEADELEPGVLEREIELARNIAENIAAGGEAPPYQPWGDGLETADFDGAGSGGSLGATPGGAQDIGYLRTVVDEGHVPFPFHLAVEGLYSEHDLPLAEGEPCDQLLCVRAGIALAPTLGSGRPSYFVQLGFSSGLTAETFERTPLNLVVVLDRSGSMSGASGEDEISKMEAVKSALIHMVGRLGPEDRLALVLFNNGPETVMESRPVDDRDAIISIIETFEPDGGTNIEAGLRRGFEIAEANSEPEERMDRVMLLTDALPNVGHHAESDFLTLAQDYADRGIGLTTFGVGVNFGQELALAISQIRGGNYFFLEDEERISEVFDLDFDYLVTPLAYDMHLTFEPSPGLSVAGVYGIPTYEEGSDTVELDVATLFLSRSRGAIVIQLQAEGDVAP